MSIVFLPATEPENRNYGVIPEEIPGHPNAVIEQVHYPELVWYNDEVRKEAITQIRAMNMDSVILVGFSKSGLGAWNIAKEIPELISATVIFDAPVSRKDLPSWGTAPFYTGDTSWQKDLPLLSIEEFQRSQPPPHKLVLISGEGFHAEMSALSEALHQIDYDHAFIPHPDMKHHWASGWVEEALNRLRQ